MKQVSPSTICVLCNNPFCERHKGSDEGVCEIKHETYYNNPAHRHRHAPVETFPSLQAREKTLRGAAGGSDVFALCTIGWTALTMASKPRLAGTNKHESEKVLEIKQNGVVRTLWGDTIYDAYSRESRAIGETILRTSCSYIAQLDVRPSALEELCY